MCKSGLAEMRQPIQGQIHAAIMLRLRQWLPRLTVDLPLYADAKVHTPVQARWLERPVDHESHVIGIHPYRNQNRLTGSDDMNVRWFHGGAVGSVALDGNDCGFSAINRERHVESIAVPVVENAEKPIRGTTAVMRRPRFQSMHEHGLTDIVINSSEPSGLPPVAVRPPHAHDSGYDCDDSRSPSRPIANFNGRKHENDSKENHMNNEIQKFDFKGAALRTLTDEAGEPWFVAKDVCDILELTNPAVALQSLDDDEKTNLSNSYVWAEPGRRPLIISEPGLYRLVMRSRKPEAKEFQRWVTHEVLPQIRRTGGYIPAGESDSDEDIMARAVLVAQKTIERKNQQLQAKDAQIKVLEPKARFADAVATSDGTCLVGELAKMLRQNGMDIGQNRLFRLLQADGYLGKSGSNRNVPTQRAMDLGLFRIKETTVTHADGHTTVSRTPKVTGKGQRYFIDRYWGRTQPTLEAGA